MKPRDLLKALLERDGDNPNSLATKLRQRTTQPQIYKYLQGVAKEPKRSTLQPIADHYGIPVDAFYDVAVAEAIMGNLRAGRPLVNRGSMATELPGFSGSGAGRTAQSTVWQAVVAIGLALESVDQITRDQAAPLLLALTKEPKRAEEFAGRLEVTLKSGNGGPGESGHRTGTYG